MESKRIVLMQYSHMKFSKKITRKSWLEFYTDELT